MCLFLGCGSQGICSFNRQKIEPALYTDVQGFFISEIVESDLRGRSFERM
jgi:hypothetical protein